MKSTINMLGSPSLQRGIQRETKVLKAKVLDRAQSDDVYYTLTDVEHINPDRHQKLLQEIPRFKGGLLPSHLHLNEPQVLAEVPCRPFYVPRVSDLTPVQLQQAGDFLSQTVYGREFALTFPHSYKEGHQELGVL